MLHAIVLYGLIKRLTTDDGVMHAFEAAILIIVMCILGGLAV